MWLAERKRKVPPLTAPDAKRRRYHATVHCEDDHVKFDVERACVQTDTLDDEQESGESRNNDVTSYAMFQHGMHDVWFYHIMPYLSFEDVIRLQRVSRMFHQFFTDDEGFTFVCKVKLTFSAL